MKGSELMRQAQAQAEADAVTGHAWKSGGYVPPSKRGTMEKTQMQQMPIDTSDMSLFPSLGGGDTKAAAQPQTQAVNFKAMMEARIEEDRQEEIRGKQKRTADIFKMTQDQLEWIGFDVLPVPDRNNPDEIAEALEAFHAGQIELEKRSIAAEGFHPAGYDDGFEMDTHLIPSRRYPCACPTRGRSNVVTPMPASASAASASSEGEEEQEPWSEYEDDE
jgi:hypothetical protein